MGKDSFEIESYDQENDGRWYATVLHICNQKPIAVYRVPSDPPVYSETEESAPKEIKE